MNVKLLKCFIGSPSDVSEERKACDEVIAAINREVGDEKGVRLETIRWEKDSHPAIGDDGQAVINAQLHPENADFFIGIFWCRFGSPTLRGESGTEEEFNLAYKRWEESHSNRIQFYFKTEPKSPTELDGVQLEKVKSFKGKVSQCGCLYREFRNVEEFKGALHEALLKELEELDKKENCSADHQRVQDELETELRQALSTYSNQNVVWIDRKLAERNDFPDSLAELHDTGKSVDIVLEDDASYVIQAPQQFGLTCLAYFLRAQAWRKKLAWLYVDASTVKLRNLEDIIAAERKRFGGAKITGVIIDSWTPDVLNAQKIFEQITQQVPNGKIIVMQSVFERIRLLQMPQIKIDRVFKVVHLLPLAKNDMRKAVCACGNKFSDDEDSMLNKIASNMEVLNIHRTPLNCWTLLKVAEGNADIGPVNRTEMLERVLFVLFNLSELPTYTSKPDVRDCERLMGGFCEALMRSGKTDFEEDAFRKYAREYVAKSYTDVDVSALWTILAENKIVVRVYGRSFRFGALFWMLFFAAKQMEIEPSFKEYVLKEKWYAQYPEIIEFYTGFGRNKSDILKLLDDDLLSTLNDMSSKLGFPKSFNPLNALSWKSADNDAEMMQKEICRAVEKSRVPSEIKDSYSDKSYNFSRPYDQSIHKYVEGASFYQFIHQLKALSRALRNSDYANPEYRLQILQHIISGWAEIARVMFFLTPDLVKLGRGFFEGYGFYLDEDFKKGNPSDRELFVRVLQACPHNVIWMMKDDLASSRQAPLLYKWSDGEASDFLRHLFALYLIHVQPRDWDKKVRIYILTLSAESFYLLNILNALKYQIECGYSTGDNNNRAIALIKDCLAKHCKCDVGSISEKKILEDVVQEGDAQADDGKENEKS